MCRHRAATSASNCSLAPAEKLALLIASDGATEQVCNRKASASLYQSQANAPPLNSFKRHGTLSLLAGIDLLTGKVPLAHSRSPPQSRVHRIPQAPRCRLSGQHCNQAGPRQSFRTHIEGKPGTRPAGRFDFTFTPKHGSWINLIEGFFSKFTRYVLRHIRVTSKHELKQRIMAGIDDANRHPVIHTWSYKLAEAA